MEAKNDPPNNYMSRMDDELIARRRSLIIEAVAVNGDITPIMQLMAHGVYLQDRKTVWVKIDQLT